MAKFSNPLGGNNEVWITQTYHGAYNRAIDLYGKSYVPNLPVYAIADGFISARSTMSGSYCVLDVNDSDMRIWYVHTYNWLPVGTKVKKGQKLCEIAPKSKNGGYPEHLHLGLTPTSKNIMDYFDRGIPFRTKYSDIKASWFKSDGTINWSKHKDLSYVKSAPIGVGSRWRFIDTMNVRDKPDGKDIGDVAKDSVCEIVSEVSRGEVYDWYRCKWADFDGWVADTDRNALSQLPITNLDGTSPPDKQELQDEIDRLSAEVNTLKLALADREGHIKILQEDYDDAVAKLNLANDRIAFLESNLEQYKEENTILEDALATCREEKQTIERDKLIIQEELDQLKTGRDDWINRLADVLHKLFGGNK